MKEKQIIEIIEDVNNALISFINNAKNLITDPIEKSIYGDCVDTYKNAFSMMKKNQLLDSIVLARTSFELLIMLFGMRINKNVKEEYRRADSYERYYERKSKSKKAIDLLSQSYLRDLILKKYPKIEIDYKRIYNIFSKFAHPTYYRNVLKYYEKEQVDVRVIYLNVINIVPLIFIELLFEENLIIEEEFEEVGILKHILERILLIYLIRYSNNEELKKADKYAYVKENVEYYKKMNEDFISDFEINEKNVHIYQEDIKKLIEKTLMKTKYYKITKEIIELDLKI